MTRDSVIAWFAAAAHVIAAAAMLFCLRGGLPLTSIDERLAYIRAHDFAWDGGWMLWHLAVVSLIALNVVLAMRLRDALAYTAVALSSVGAAIDIATQSRYIAILPQLEGEAFARLDRELEVMTGYAANGLYTLAMLLLVISGWRVFPRAANLLAVPILIAGFALSLAALLHEVVAEVVTSAILFPLLTLWMIVLARWLRRSA